MHRDTRTLYVAAMETTRRHHPQHGHYRPKHRAPIPWLALTPGITVGVSLVAFIITAVGWGVG